MSKLAARIPRPAAKPATPFGPDSIEVHPRALRVGDGWCRSFAVTGYPREVGRGWLEPLCAHPGRLDVALHVEPVPAALAAERLRRQLARLESNRRADVAKGRLADPDVEVAADDARELAAGLARGEQKLFRVGLVLTVHAADEKALDAECARVRALCASMLLDARAATWRSLQGWASTLPLGVDALGQRRAFDTDALAAAFPFASAELSATSGVLYGTTARGTGLVCWDRFAQDNHNSVILARSGAGKSYLAKLEALRSLYQGIEIAVVDPEDEYRRLAETVGGAYVHLGAPGVRVNPFDLDAGPGTDGGDPDAGGSGGGDPLGDDPGGEHGGALASGPVVRRALFVHTLVAVLLGEKPDPQSAAALDRGIVSAYEQAGITADPRSHARPAPLLADLAAALDADGDPAARALAARLAPYVTGTHRGLFDGPTTTRPDGHLVVFSLRDLPDELKAAGTLLTLDAIWRRVSDPARRKRRLVVVDEAWLLMAERSGAEFLFRMAKSARKHWAGLTVVTQDAADLLGSPLGQAVVANAATQILLRQAPQTIDTLAEAFGLSAGERAYLLGAARGQGLLAAGQDRVAFSALASPAEDAICRTGISDALCDVPDL
ncbi:MAG: conjugal transfer protein TraC [Actinomycetota bacterium]|nr:conjugal transfer protein TraC [Actinomycetota bacterium]